jgi:5-formyltetrahydrofolate cyclo-ligase
MPAAMTDIAAEKKQMRLDAAALRDALPREARQDAAEAIAARPFPLKVGVGVVVSGFMPMKSEINPLPLLRRLEDMGARIALPAIAGRGKPLVMRQWRFGEPLAAGVWGIREPKAEAPEVDPDILLVPLLAFDRAGYRVGYGGGYYDLTISTLRAKKNATAVGIAFAAQQVAKVPATERDARLDLVLTEREVIDLRNA